MTIDDLKATELSNLYALTKQVNAYFNESEIAFLLEETQLLLMDYLRMSVDLENQVQDSLRTLSINPGNTIDSVGQEITDNLSEIIKQDIEDDAKAKGYMMSLNRLMSYHLANLENVQHLDMYDRKVEELGTFGERLTTMRSRLLT